MWNNSKHEPYTTTSLKGKLTPMTHFEKIIAAVFVCTLPFTAKAKEAVADIRLSPAGSFKATTQDVKGNATLTGNKITAENIVVNLKSLKTGIAVRDSHTQKHLETTQFPEAILVKAEGTDGKGTGVLRIHGVEKPVSGTYKINGNELEAEFKINLPDYKITNIKYMGVGVKDEVTVSVKVPLAKK